jgi:hypothetical protein
LHTVLCPETGFITRIHARPPARSPARTNNGTQESLLHDDSLDTTVSQLGAAAAGHTRGASEETLTGSPALTNVQEHVDERAPPDFGDFGKTSALLENAAAQARLKFENLFDMPDNGLPNSRAYASRTTYCSSDDEDADRALEVDDFSEEC